MGNTGTSSKHNNTEIWTFTRAHFCLSYATFPSIKIWRKYKMEEFATLEKVKELFEKVDFIGEENCFIYALTNTQKPAHKKIEDGLAI